MINSKKVKSKGPAPYTYHACLAMGGSFPRMKDAKIEEDYVMDIFEKDCFQTVPSARTRKTDAAGGTN